MNSEYSRLEDIAEVIDSLHKTPSYIAQGFPMVRVTDVKYGNLDLSGCHRVDEDTYLEFSRRFKPKIGDIVITRVGTYGVSARVMEGGFCLGQNTAAIVPKSIDSRYLYAALNSEFVRSQIEAGAVGSTQKTLSLKHIKALNIPRQGSQTEESIAEIIGGLDDRITLLRETNTTLEAIAQALFKSWFVDFDPVRAKTAGLEPEGMDAATAALFPNSFEESEFGLIPLGWQVSTVAALGDVICGKTPATSNPENYGDDVPFITIPDMHSRLVVTSTNRSLSRLGADSQKKKYLLPGSICVSCIATPGLVVRVTSLAQTNQQINSVVPFDKWGKSFPLFLLRRIGDAVRTGGSGGSVFHNLSKSGFEALRILLTDEVLAKKFDDIVEPLLAKIVANQEQVQALTHLRNSLLPRLISGQMRLPAPEVNKVCG